MMQACNSTSKVAHVAKVVAGLGAILGCVWGAPVLAQTSSVSLLSPSSPMGRTNRMAPA